MSGSAVWGIPHSLVVAATVLSATPAPRAQDRPVPPAVVRPLDLAARQTAKAGRTADALELVAVLKALGHPERQCEALEATCRQEGAKAKRTAASVPEAARTVRDVARRLANLLADVPEDSRDEVARQIIRLDGSVDEPHLILEHKLGRHGWLSPWEEELRERRGAIQDALARARRLPVELSVAASAHPLLVAVHGGPGVKVTRGGLSVHGSMNAHKLERIVREALRAAAVSGFLVKGELVVPAGGREDLILLHSRVDYDRAIEEAKKAGLLDGAAAERAKELAGFYCDGSLSVLCAQMENTAQSHIFSDLVMRFTMPNAQACLEAGHINWVCLAYLGTSSPVFAWTELIDHRRPGSSGVTRAGAVEAEDTEREEVFRLAKAGLAGCRAWLAWLAARREDPPWARSMVDQIGKITGEDLLKTTMVVEFLQEHGPLRDLVRATRPTIGEPNPAARFEEELEETLEEFEERWRRWIVPQSRSLVERLDRAPPRGLSKSERELLDHLNQIRRRALTGATIEEVVEVALEPSLSDGAKLHCEYLAAHPEQAAAWPDAHEEYPDRDGFTPEGAWAGGHAVIAPGVASATEAVDAWMGTFYHRLPLLEPGLLRVGWALEKGIAALDTGSMTRPSGGYWAVMWPPDRARGVPVRFCPELPNPVPGADQSAFGYPITLMLSRPMDEVQRVTLKLLDGSGNEVPCHVSTPTEPTNPELAPAGAWCLIPKSVLRPGVNYTVSAETAPKEEKITWTFRT